MKGLVPVMVAVVLSGTLYAEQLCGVERLTQFDRLPELLEGAPACRSLTVGSRAIEQEPSLSRDGSQLAFVTGDGSVWTARVTE